MIAKIIIFLLLVIIVVLLYIPLIVKVIIQNNNISIKLVILKVIKINIKEKTTFEKINQKKVLKTRIPIKKLIGIAKESLPSIRYLALKTKMNIRINGIIGLSSADKTALTTGIINIFLYYMEGIFNGYFKELSGEYNISPDFVSERFEYSISAEIFDKPFNIIIFSIKWLKVLLKYKKYILRKGGASNAGSSNRRLNENYNG